MNNQIEYFLTKPGRKIFSKWVNLDLKKKKNPHPILQFHLAGNYITAFSQTASLHSFPEAIVVEIGEKKGLETSWHIWIPLTNFGMHKIAIILMDMFFSVTSCCQRKVVLLAMVKNRIKNAVIWQQGFYPQLILPRDSLTHWSRPLSCQRQP